MKDGAAWGRVYRATLVVIAAALLAAFVREAVVARPWIGGVDFYQDVVVSRDLVNGVRDLPDARYEHLPGLQHFWRAAILVGGGSLASLQWIYLGVLVANLVLVGALALRLTGWPEAALLAVAWMFALDGRLQVYLACGERVAMLPCLLGLLAWSGRPLRGREGLARAVALGVGLGLGVYMKRQAGLVALGAVAFLPLLLASEKARPRWGHLLAIPTVAVSVLVAAVLLEGRGLEPFRIALGALPRYNAYGTAAENELIIIRLCPELLLGPALLLLAVAGWIVVLAKPERRAILEEPASALLGFAGVAASVTFLQFTKRPYAHHGLLATPFLALGLIAAGRVFLARFATSKLARPSVLALAVVLGAPLAHMRYAGPEGDERPWPSDEVTRREVAEVARIVHPREDVLLLPPEGRNDLHFILGTTARSNPVGYDWAPELGLKLDGVRWSTVDAVVVLLPRSDYDLLHWISYDCGRVVQSLPDRGFAPVYTGTRCLVYRR